ncbi:hypothetical protein pdul_cds_301 [Pandoravirus dulcis]|uniref:F-box incomplete domain containing protein n=1 Tax=Pandoravirus dulcis TaxID=1349409 RepID=S4VPT8_9VIRU|nr:hypothetical protein pdul_cds_301 [Pandoravirus dulcis]AGO82287.2 hypothetical protein pdul_cds_301 [Pandoravirus dulcis]
MMSDNSGARRVAARSGPFFLSRSAATRKSWQTDYLKKKRKRKKRPRDAVGGQEKKSVAKRPLDRAQGQRRDKKRDRRRDRETSGMEALPTEILDMILNGLDARGVPFLHPAWRFAARLVHPRWAAVLASVEAAKTTLNSPFHAAWEAPVDRGRRPRPCLCPVRTHGRTRHPDFVWHLAHGRFVSARCAIGRPWVFECCGGSGYDAVPVQHRIIIAVLSMPAPATDATRVAALIAPCTADDDHLAPGIKAIRHHDLPASDATTGSYKQMTHDVAKETAIAPSRHVATEFVWDLCGASIRCNRADVVRALASFCPDLERRPTIHQILYDACYADNVEVVEDTLMRTHAHAQVRPRSVHKWHIWTHAAAGGTAVLERLLVLCDRQDHAKPYGDDGARTKEGAHEARLAEMARLTRPADDTDWQLSAVRNGNVDALALGERYGVPVDAHQLVRSLDIRAGHACLRWIAARALNERVAPQAIARACRGPLGSVVTHAVAVLADDLGACAQHRQAWVADATRDVTEFHDTVDALCRCVALGAADDEAGHWITGFVYTYMQRTIHTAAGLSLVARLVRAFPAQAVEAMGALLWSRLVDVVVRHAGFDALDGLVSIGVSRALWEPSLPGWDLWSMAVERVRKAIKKTSLSMSASDCAGCVVISRSRARDHAVSLLARITAATCADATTQGDAADAHVLAWCVACRPRPIDPMVLGGGSLKHEAPSVTALRVLLRAHGLLA